MRYEPAQPSAASRKMPIDSRAVATWNRAENAYQHYAGYVASKSSRHTLTVTDLIYVKNFKGGSTTIGEPVASATDKLAALSRALLDAASSGDLNTQLSKMDDALLVRAKRRIIDFVKLATQDGQRISGLGPSLSSALLHFYFPASVPILDRRVLNGARIPGIQVSSQGQVSNAMTLYPALIDYFALRLREDASLTVRSLDRLLFVKKLGGVFARARKTILSSRRAVNNVPSTRRRRRS
jgi:hypothetical protein